MKRSTSRRTLAGLALAVSLAAGCGGAGNENVGAEAAAVARARAQRDWMMQLDWAGAQTQVPLQSMSIFLVEDETQHPEIFEISGSDAELVGEFPLDVHVGYEAAYDRLIGKAIEIRPSGGNPREPKNSWVRLGGVRMPVVGGSFTVEKLTGKWEGSEGDKTLWGTIELRVPAADGEQAVHGKIAVHCVTWG
jgi:hypothetical protein